MGAGANASAKSKGSVFLQLLSNIDHNFSCQILAQILPKLTGNIPSVRVDNSSWPHLLGLQLADSKFYEPAPVDIILGADVYHHIIQHGLKEGNQSEPIAQSTKFGWIISGPVKQNSSSNLAQTYQCSVETDMYKLIEKFWLQEEVIVQKSALTPSEQECEENFKTSYTRDPSGKYIVRLPFKSPPTTLGETRVTATRMLNRLFRRFTVDKQFESSYQNFLQEYNDLGHMSHVSSETSPSSSVYYLPHHGVLQNSRGNSKLRVVFNGSSKSSTGISLNDILHSGTKLQTDLIDVLLRFRKFRYAFSTDIEKMYRQIMVHPHDWCFQRILWRDSLGNDIPYNLTTVTHGLACAPFLALRVLNQLVEDEGERFPLAVPVLTKERYVDDIFGGGDSIETVRELVSQVEQLCLTAGMPLRKWVSNNPAVLINIPESHRLPVTSVPIEQSITALGLSWKPNEDAFHFLPGTFSESNPTKRTISSQIARLFDPLGFLAPVTIKAKALLQELWTLGLSWDDRVPPQIEHTWFEFVHQLHNIRFINIPRWVGIDQMGELQIHGFSDASMIGMGAVVYLRSSFGDHVKTTLVCAKTKVAPLKRLTIPRLELGAATILAHLTFRVVETLELKNTPIYLWTDSSIVHTWVNNHSSKWKDYVHNRVRVIQDTLPHAQWKWIPSQDNPADCASRGTTPQELSAHNIWWNGPPWLVQSYENWPCEVPSLVPEESLESRSKLTSHMARQPPNEPWDLLTRYSNLTRLLRVTAMCQRVVKKFRHHLRDPITDPLTPDELQNAKYFWVRQCQNSNFGQEITTLTTGNLLPRQHPFNRLTPFVDSSGLLRVGGRLENSMLSYENKHPVILPRHSPLSTLIISDAHSRTIHGSTQITLSFIRSSCWIVGGRAPVRSFIYRCVKCARLRRKNAQQIMGQLPFTRVNPVARPFINAGIDYAGPLHLKTWSGRAAKTYKAYIVLFICQATSAIHLELVTDYTAEAFLAAYRRFASRRGICQTLSSDCGTNLKGADAELQRLFSQTSAELGKLAGLIANDGTKWLFNPPAAPHFGGKWEAGVKSVKYHLRRTIDDTVVTYEEMSTVLTQIESILNSRPLCPLTDDPLDISVLTPGHFLIGQPLNTIPEPNLQKFKLNRLSHWQRLRQMMESFWTRWSREYLQRLQAIYKWNQPLESISVGQLVLIMDERYPPLKWPLGRVTQSHPGKDGHVRVATIQTQTTSITRPISKLCPLPIPKDQ